MGGERQQRGMEANGIAVTLEHGALKIIVEENPSGPAKRGKGAGVPSQKAPHAGIQEESQVESPREAQHHHEGHQWTAGAPDLQMTEVRPLRRVPAHAECSFGRIASPRSRLSIHGGNLGIASCTTGCSGT
jgi:hypothetical protein